MSVDWALSSQGATVAAYVTGYGRNNQDSYVNDNNNNTAAVGDCSAVGTGTVIFEVTFAGPRNLDVIKFLLQHYQYSQSTTVAYYSGSSWYDLETFYGLLTATWKTYSAGYENVSKIRVYATLERYGAPGWEQEYIWIWTMMVTGSDYYDSGIRIRNANATISIARAPLGASDKYRFRKGSTTIAIPIVPTTDPLASPLRMYDGNSVKALMKYS